MGLPIKELIAAIRSNGRGGGDAKIAVIADRYFMFEESGFNRGSLRTNEIASMAKMSSEGLVPSGKHRTASGYFVRNHDTVIAFIASQERLLSEIPELSSCKYWIPAKFFLECVDPECAIGEGKNCITFAINYRGEFVSRGKKLRMFSKAFWTAELHPDEERSGNRGMALLNLIALRIIAPLVLIFSGLLLSCVALLVQNSIVEIDRIKLREKQKTVNDIIERSKLRDEIFAFSSGKSSFFRCLNAINGSRPATLLFKDFTMQANGAISISGACDAIKTLDEFVDALKREKFIGAVNCSNVGHENGATAFELSVEFRGSQL
jgi:hypothetical protein